MSDRPHNSRPVAAVKDDKAKQIDVLITDNRTIVITKLCKCLKMSHSSICSLEQFFSYSQICEKWLPRMPTYSMKEQGVGTAQL